MLSDWIQVLGALGLGSTLTAVIGAALHRRVTNADARKVEISGELQISAAAIELVETLRTELERLTRRVEILEAENDSLEQRVAELVAENSRLRKS